MSRTFPVSIRKANAADHAAALGVSETGLFDIQSEFQLTRRQDASRQPGQRPPTPIRANGHERVLATNERDGPPARDQEPLSTMSMRPSLGRSKSRAIAQCFLRLSNLDPTLLDRVGSYEARLWRQAAQTIWTLDAMRRPPPAPTRRSFRKPVCSPIGLPSARE
jgi:hypothetical protein